MSRRTLLFALILMIMCLVPAAFASQCSSTSCVTLSNVTPANNASVSSPVTFTATATSSSGAAITGWHIYVDSVDSYSSSGGSQLNASISVGNGTHTVIIRAWDSTGAYGDTTITITVGTPTVTVVVSQPANNATLASPVEIKASATSNNNNATVTGWVIYVDGTQAWNTPSGSVNPSIDAMVNMTTGAHSVLVRAWDSTGAYGSQTLTLTISAPTGNGTVTGKVTDSTTGSPVGGATVAWSGGKTTTSSPTNGVSTGHVFLVAEENTSYTSVVGNTAMPYLNNTLIPKGVLLTNYYANTHGSLLDYLEVESGGTWTTQCNGDHCSTTSPDTNAAQNFVVNQDNLVRAINAAGKTWKGYFESMPSQGFLGTASTDGLYVERHNPFPWFTDLNSTAQQNNMYPFTQFATDLSGNNFANFNFIVPNLNDDMHNGTPAAADQWLQTNIAPLLASSYFQPGGDGILILWFDEGTLSPADNTNGGGHVVQVMLGPGLKTGYQDNTFGQHQNTLRMIVENLGLSDFMNDAGGTATDFNEAYLGQSGGGTYSLSNVTSGTQTLTFSATGYDTKQASVTVPSGGTATLNQSLPPTTAGNSTGSGPLDVYYLTGSPDHVHDPSIIYDSGSSKYYVFSTDFAYGDGIKFKCSSDKITWSACGHVFNSTPSWVTTKYPTFGQNGQGFWDPTIYYWGGQYHLYYVASIWGANNSSIGLATNPTLDPNNPNYLWTDQGEVLSSTTSDNFNALGPRVTVDDSGNYWLSYGSYLSGIHQRALDPSTGKLSTTNLTDTILATRTTPNDEVEGQTIWKHGSWWYMFVSFDQCCSGAQSTYKIAVGRSANEAGPYTDESGTALTNSGGTVILQGNSLWAGPGHPFVYKDVDGSEMVAFHAYATSDGTAWLHLNLLSYDASGWPVISPCSPGVQCGGGGGNTGSSPGTTTTLSAETSGNTSASSNWTTSSNNDLAGTYNISKVSVKDLLYGGNTTAPYMNFLLWWCTSSPGNVSTTSYCRSHIQIGYNSDDATQVHNQMNDIFSRGFIGPVIDWYGRGNLGSTDAQWFENDTALKTVADITQYQGTRPLKFALMYDHIVSFTCGSGAYSSHGYGSLDSCIIGEIDADMDYANANFFNSPYALKVNGHPVVIVFITESGSEFSGANWTSDWSSINTHVAGESNGSPYFLFLNTFTHTAGAGAYTWVNNNNGLSSAYANNEGLDYLDGEYNNWKSTYSSEQFFGGGWKGFNDSLATWGSGRLMNQKCGLTWVDTFAEASKYFSTAFQLPYLQVSTWNDYEEGTEVESGIDSCNTVTASISGASVSFSKGGSGSGSTVDHYTVYYSTDGQNLTVLQDNISPSTTSINLQNYGFPSAGTYTIYVKLVSKNSLTNAMSGPLTYTVSGNAPVAAINVSPTSGAEPLTVNADTSGSYDSSGIVSRIIDWGDGSAPVTLTSLSAAHTYTTAGNFTVKLTIKNTLGIQANTTQNVNVTAGASSNTATFSLLTNGAYVYSPMRVLGQITTVNPPLTHARIYVDGAVVYDVPFDSGVFTVDKYVFLSGGSWHTIMLEGVDKNGNSWDSSSISVYCIGHVY